VIIMCAAVSDFRPAASADTKIAKADASLTLALQPTPDILAWLGRNRVQGQRLVGFAMETHQAHEHARNKLRKKAVDAILMNELREGRSGFATERNELTLIREGVPDREFSGPKSEIALQALNALVEGWREESGPA
jgi:phosphopantothenoylcysteine decarboxylase/phosphopantothenate--cysteine ligase